MPTPEPPAPTPSATWYCNKCGKVGDAATRARAEKQHAILSPTCDYSPAWVQTPVPPASAPACATVPNDSTCPCGTALVRDGEVVHSHWTGNICSECEQAIIEKYNARMREAHRD